MPTPKSPDGNLYSLPLRGFEGLSLKVDFANRARNSWQQLDNFDLYVPGSLRKVLPALLYGGPYGANGLNCIEYLAQPNNPQGGIRRALMVGADGKIYDLASATPATALLDTSALLGVPPTIPFLVQSSGFYVPFNVRTWQKNTIYAKYDAVLEYSPTDGVLYVFYASVGGTSGANEPIWPNGGSVADNTVTWTWTDQPNSTRFLTNYLDIVVPGVRPVRVNEWQYDPTSITEAPKYTKGQMGVSPPAMPIQLSGTQITPNLNGYSPASGRAYLWTLYNPQTLQESAPAPFTGKTVIVKADSGFASVTINGSILLPLPPGSKSTPYSSYQSYYMAIPVSALTPIVGQGYSTVRVYATHDGGQTFFLVPTLFDNNGNQISNGDGSIPITLLTALQAANGWTDYFPVPEAQNAQISVRIYEGGGPINLVPDPVNLGTAAWTQQQVSTNPIFVASGAAPDGANAFEYDDSGGGGSTGGPFSWVSAGIAVTPGTQYYFQMYLDKSQGTVGTMKVMIVNGSGTALLTLTQADSTVSTLSGTVTPTVKTIKVKIQVSGVTVAAGGSLLWADPVLQVGAVLNTVATNYPTPDNALITPAPNPLTNYPPPIAAMAEVINDALHLVDNADQTKIWYTNQGQFEKMGANAFVRTTISKNADQILELIKCFDRLLIEKGRSVEQITSYPPSQPVAVDPQHGALARRAAITYGSSILGLFTNGLGQVNLAASIQEDRVAVGMQGQLFGDDIKPLIDTITPATLRATNNGPKLPCPVIYNKFDLFMLANSQGAGYNDNVLMYYMGRSKGFSKLTALPNGQTIITLKEIQLPAGGTGNFALAGNGDYFLLALTSDGNSYVLFQGKQDGTVTATAVTQPLPTVGDVDPQIYDEDKIFESMWVEGEDLSNFQVYVATDGQFDTTGVPTSYPWGPLTITNNAVKLGMSGKQIVLKFIHSAASVAGIVPMLSYIGLDFRLEGALT